MNRTPDAFNNATPADQARGLIADLWRAAKDADFNKEAVWQIWRTATWFTEMHRDEWRITDLFQLIRTTSRLEGWLYDSFRAMQVKAVKAIPGSDEERRTWIDLLGAKEAFISDTRTLIETTASIGEDQTWGNTQ